ncbi:uncharacterized protein ColSpa_01466 [Colletotrichum spaethianum]|uniref:Uncharacterized protein n=1 Tax=Colletotrichum spaethianum TaxID=700344 RepID=A0AA37P4I2_9PEZI|nr:uncharacterized protein ColSpa_01466 [Colletotrichum spaethianum]GKT41286.1 hypothetical protein ColSpa_01466 [Colletotrichum spaethianum]
MFLRLTVDNEERDPARQLEPVDLDGVGGSRDAVAQRVANHTAVDGVGVSLVGNPDCAGRDHLLENLCGVAVAVKHVERDRLAPDQAQADETQTADTLTGEGVDAGLRGCGDSLGVDHDGEVEPVGSVDGDGGRGVLTGDETQASALSGSGRCGCRCRRSACGGNRSSLRVLGQPVDDQNTLPANTAAKAGGGAAERVVKLDLGIRHRTRRDRGVAREDGLHAAHALDGVAGALEEAAGETLRNLADLNLLAVEVNGRRDPATILGRLHGAARLVEQLGRGAVLQEAAGQGLGKGLRDAAKVDGAVRHLLHEHVRVGLKAEADGGALAQTLAEARGGGREDAHDLAHGVGVAGLAEELVGVDVGGHGLGEREAKGAEDVGDARVVWGREVGRVGVELEAGYGAVADARGQSEGDGLELVREVSAHFGEIDGAEKGRGQADAQILDRRVQAGRLHLVVSRDLGRDLHRLGLGRQVQPLSCAGTDADTEEHARSVEVADQLVSDVFEAVRQGLEKAAEDAGRHVSCGSCTSTAAKKVANAGELPLLDAFCLAIAQEIVVVQIIEAPLDLVLVFLQSLPRLLELGRVVASNQLVGEIDGEFNHGQEGPPEPGVVPDSFDGVGCDDGIESLAP